MDNEFIIVKDEYKSSRVLYILEATLEYFISLMVAGVYLARLTSAIGLSDSFTGILSSLVSLGCGFQIFALLFAGKKSVKRTVTIFHSINQLFFALIFFVPFFNLSIKVKSIIFTALLLIGHALNNVIHAPKINWYMSLVDDHKRGKFTANKEIVSLISGVVFTTTMGAVIDEFERVGNLYGSFIFCGVGVFLLALSHSLTLIFSKEKELPSPAPTVNLKNNVKQVLKDKNILKIILVSVIWNIASYASTPFYGTYIVKELGFSMLLVSIISAIGAFSRASFSRPFGKFADKRSFASLINLCFIFELLAFLIRVFVAPKTKYLYIVYLVLYSIGMAGINSGTINLIYDYVSHERRTSALALQSTVTGLTGFFTTLVASRLVEKIQLNNNSFLGLNLYAQQVVTMISVAVLIVEIIYINLVVKKINRN